MCIPPDFVGVLLRDRVIYPERRTIGDRRAFEKPPVLPMGLVAVVAIKRDVRSLHSIVEEFQEYLRRR
ncbi:MAG: hypothetical protein H0U31_10470 [Chloroflexia bacterium]|nr:hypothetical protein [Chloroflexia bacterium]